MADNGNKFVTFLKNNWIKYLVQTVIALILSLIVMNFRGAFNSELASADRFKGVCDGFSVTAMLYISFGILIWVSTTGFFDIFAYAFRKGAHAIIPGMGLDRSSKSYYDYKQDKMERRNTKPMYSTLIIGVLFLVISIILVMCWYSL